VEHERIGGHEVEQHFSEIVVGGELHGAHTRLVLEIDRDSDF